MAKLKTTKALFDPSGNSDHRSIGAHPLGVIMPANAVICGGAIEVITTCQSAAGGTDKATIAVHVSSANDIVSAVAIETGTPWDDGFRAIIPAPQTASTWVKPTAAKEITVTVGTAALTAGKFWVHLWYFQGDAE